MIRLVVCDMDGTMFGHNEQLSPDTATWINDLEERGIFFTVATGRAEGYMRIKAKEMGLRHPYIVTNGATIMKNDQAVLRKQFPILPLREFIEHCYKENMSVMFTFQGESRTESITPWIEREGVRRGRPYFAEPLTTKEWETLMADKILVMDSEREGKILEVEKRLQTIPGDFSYVRYQLKALELNERSANKAHALSTLSEMLGIPLNQVLVIGDDDNDIQMFQTAGYSAAVGNVSEGARPYARYICENREFEGVKEAVARFCGGK